MYITFRDNSTLECDQANIVGSEIIINDDKDLVFPINEVWEINSNKPKRESKSNYYDGHPMNW